MGESSDHALLSPSSAKRWMACTPSARFEQQFPSTTSVFAEEGTLAHSLAEVLLKNRLGLITTYDLQNWLDLSHINPLYSEEMRTHAEQYADYCMTEVYEKTVAAVETRLDLTSCIPESFGTGDFMAVQPSKRRLVFRDLKYGKGVAVSSVENEQLKIYAIGALDWWGFVYDIDTVSVGIYQPRINNNSEWEIAVPDLLKWCDEVLKPAAIKAFAGEGEYVVGEHCKFCKARVRCEALANHNLDLFKHELADKNVMSDAAIADIVLRVPMLVDWAKDIHEYATAEMIKGKQLPGLKLVEGKSNRVFVSEHETEKKLLEAGHTDIYTPKELLGVTKLKTAIGAKVFKELVEPDLRKPAGKPTLVPESDPRPDFDRAVAVFRDAEIQVEVQEE